METKRCNKCGKNLPLTRFHRRTYSSGTVGLQTRCKSCQTNLRREYYKPDEKTRQKLKISDEFYEELMSNDNCQICGCTMTKKCIDHCHETKKIRGVLCNNCNTALGLFNDNQKVMKDAIQYLEQSTQLH